MELGGVSLRGLSPQGGGAYLAKDLSVFASQLGGLKAFVMVSDGTADDTSDGVAALLASKAADAYLESVLMRVATGQTQEFDPAATLTAVVAAANTAVVGASADPANSMRATFYGALISEDRAWFASIGQGRGWLLRGDEARELGADSQPAVSTVAADTSDVAETALALGQEGVEAHVASVFLIPGDAIVLAGQGASTAMSGAEILSTACVACDANVAATNIANVAAKVDPDQSITVALWSADSAMFKPVPVVVAPVPAVAATAPESAAAPTAAPWPDVAPAATVSRGAKAEKIFLWVMSAWIVIAFLALGGAALFSVNSPSMRASAGGASDSAAQSAAVEPTTPPSTEPVAPSEFPKQLVAPKNVKGGLWLRRSATTVGGGNEVVILKGGAKVTAVDSAMGTDDKGQPQEFYILNVSDISASQVIKSKLHPWPPAKSIKKLYVFAGSF
jgi:hypothetical protein